MYGYDDNTSLEIVQRLTFIAAGNVNFWFSTIMAAAPFAGCGNKSGYLSFLDADDDDGNISEFTDDAITSRSLVSIAVTSHFFIVSSLQTMGHLIC